MSVAKRLADQLRAQGPNDLPRCGETRRLKFYIDGKKVTLVVRIDCEGNFSLRGLA